MARPVSPSVPRPFYPFKYARTKSLAEIGACHSTFDALWASLPASLREELAARQLALIIDALRYQHVRGEYRGWIDGKELECLEAGSHGRA